VSICTARKKRCFHSLLLAEKQRRDQVVKEVNLTLVIKLIRRCVRYGEQDMARMRFLDPSSYVDWVFWFSTLFWDVFSRGAPVFPSHQKPTFDLICCDSVWFIISSTRKATVLHWIPWDWNQVIVIKFVFYTVTRRNALFFPLYLIPRKRFSCWGRPIRQLTSHCHAANQQRWRIHGSWSVYRNDW